LKSDRVVSADHSTVSSSGTSYPRASEKPGGAT